MKLKLHRLRLRNQNQNNSKEIWIKRVINRSAAFFMLTNLFIKFSEADREIQFRVSNFQNAESDSD